MSALSQVAVDACDMKHGEIGEITYYTRVATCDVMEGCARKTVLTRFSSRKPSIYMCALSCFIAYRRDRERAKD